EISFNYLGQFTSLTGEGENQPALFEFSPMSTGEGISPESEQTHCLAISGIAAEGKLTLSAAYNKYEYNKTTIRLFMDSFKASLLQIIRHCMEQKESRLTPSDVTDVGTLAISLETFSWLVDHIERNRVGKPGIKFIYHLSPMQRGMLYHVLAGGGSDLYFNQTVFHLEGEIRARLLAASFNKLVERYDIFRTLFIHEGLEEPVQVVLDRCQVPIHHEDTSGLTAGKQAAYLEEYRKKDKTRGFDL
ncbi:MAG: hypothetical protein GY940_18725, partial [bacterium]|nr:hypothetical protein [bacterium]